jgi:hypothetical protein
MARFLSVSVSSVTIARRSTKHTAAMPGSAAPGQTLFIHPQRIVAALNQMLRHLGWQVFVGLEPHHRAAGSVTTRPDARSAA